MTTTPRSDAALEADSESGGTRQLVALCRELEGLCSHIGIFRAQENHNAMIAEKDAEIQRLRAALERIERWELPPSGRHWPVRGEETGAPMSYGAAFGSNGERDYMRQLARDALGPN